MIRKNTSQDYKSRDLTDALKVLNNKYILLAHSFVSEFKNYVSKTNTISNEHCIVFHNNIDKGNNILFTGDIRKSIWKEFKEELHVSYSVIKAPHHGTSRYYFDFSKYVIQDSYLLLPNGGIEEWPICHKYSDLLSTKTYMVCNKDCNCQKQNTSKKCFCPYKKQVGTLRIYMDILFS